MAGIARKSRSRVLESGASVVCMEDGSVLRGQARSAVLAELSAAAGAWEIPFGCTEIESVNHDLSTRSFRVVASSTRTWQVARDAVLRSVDAPHPVWWAFVSVPTSGSSSVLFVHDDDVRRVALCNLGHGRNGSIPVSGDDFLPCAVSRETLAL
jgi:hypothetical protein